MMNKTSGNIASTSAIPFNIPLHFSNELKEDEEIRGPRLPLNWRNRWSQNVEKINSDILWPEFGLKKWITSSTYWQINNNNQEDQLINTNFEPPIIAIEDEKGTEIPLKTKPISKSRLGNKNGGKRIALGMQDGSIWIMQEKFQDFTIPSTPPNLPFSLSTTSITPTINSTETLMKNKTASRSSLVLSPASPSASIITNGSIHRSIENEIVSPSSAISEINASSISPKMTFTTSGMDAEENLEKQFHAGNKDQPHSMMSGMMEALGLQHGNHSHDHIHNDHHHHQRKTSSTGNSTPSKRYAKSVINFAPRSRKASNATEKSFTRRENEVVSNSKEESIYQNRDITLPIEKIEPLLLLQCVSDSPIQSLQIKVGKDNCDVLCSIQQDGKLTLWSLNDSLNVQKIDLCKTSATGLEPEIATASTTMNSPLAKLISIRNSAGSPQPRSRTNSNASRPDTSTATSFSSPQTLSNFVDVSCDIENLFVTYDLAKSKIYIIDTIKGVNVIQQTLSDVGLIKPCTRLSSRNEFLDVYYINKTGNFFVQPIRIKSKVKVPSSPELRSGPLSQATAFLRREGYSRPNSRPASIHEEVFDEKKDLGSTGIEGQIDGFLCLKDGYCISYNNNIVSLSRRVSDSLLAINKVEISSIQEVTSNDKDVIVVKREGQLVKLQVNNQGRLQNVNTDEFSGECDQFIVMSNFDSTILCQRDSQDRITLSTTSNRILWQSQPPFQGTNRFTAALPFSMERIVLTLASGHILMTSLSNLIGGSIALPEDDSNASFEGNVCLLQSIVNPRTNLKHIFGGTIEGDVISWDSNTLQRQAQYSLLCAPIVAFIPFGHQDSAVRLHGCVACVGADGSIAIIVLDGLRYLYIIPGRNAPVELLAVRSNELLIIYKDSRARVWNMSSLELRRSIGIDQAMNLLEDGSGWWAQFHVGMEFVKGEKGSAGVLSAIPSSRNESAAALTADLRRLVEAASRMVRTEAQDAIIDSDDINEISPKSAGLITIDSSQGKRAINAIRPMLHILIPWDLVEMLDFQKAIGINSFTNKSTSSGIFNHPGYLAITSTSNSAATYCISSAISSNRMIAILALLGIASRIAELQSLAQEAISRICNLKEVVGEDFCAPSLNVLVEYLMDPILDIKHASELLFSSALEDISKVEFDGICEEYQNHLPSKTDSGEESLKALLLLGLLATHRYTEMPPNLLKDISISTTIFLNDSTNEHRQLIAILLCDRGFAIFQHYFDAMEVVRTLFSLSTLGKDATMDDPSAMTANTPEIRNLARQATLRIAQDNTPLFMTTLSLDILHARSAQHCSATMRLVAMMVRKRPMILYPNLPRLAEAVVKSLDPTITAMRTVLHRSATIIISELVATYPTIAFHKGLQRLAVGTFEGAIIMYDLKTATRLYVLEAHAASLNGLLFSEDGRRLVSISLSDGMLKVWKTGVGFGSLFNFGGAPRQAAALLGRKAALDEPSSTEMQKDSSNQGVATPCYKSFDFGRMVGTTLAKKSAVADTGIREFDDFSLVKLGWQAERSIRIHIGEEANLVFDVA